MGLNMILLLVTLNILVPCVAFMSKSFDIRHTERENTRLFHSPDRRDTIKILGSISVGILAGPSLAEDKQKAVLESRLVENSLQPPPYGMEGSDVFYPSWFEGRWKVASTCNEVQAPCGNLLFGGNQTFAAAQKEVGNTTLYESRFLRTQNDNVVADREFNVRSIAKAAMGSNSVLDIPLSTPNKMTCILAPEGAPTNLRVDLLILNRLQEPAPTPTQFFCSEVARQIVAPLGSAGAPSATLLKEIETISLYEQIGDVVTCRQRSATFLLPSQQNPQATYLWQASRGRPIDVRFYTVKYTKV